MNEGGQNHDTGYYAGTSGSGGEERDDVIMTITETEAMEMGVADEGEDVASKMEGLYYPEDDESQSIGQELELLKSEMVNNTASSSEPTLMGEIISGQQDERQEEYNLEYLSNVEPTPTDLEEMETESDYSGSIAAAVKRKRRAASKNVKNIVQKQLVTVAPNIKLSKTKVATEEIEDVEIEPPLKPILPSEDTCSNCLQVLEEKFSEISTAGKTSCYSIAETLYSIFRVPNLSTEEVPPQLFLCIACHKLLTMMYSAFEEFIGLAKDGSFITLQLRNLDEEIAKLRQKSRRGRKPKNPANISGVKTNINTETDPLSVLSTDEDDASEFITGDLYDEEFMASPSDLAAVGLESSSSCSDDDGYIPLQKIRYTNVKFKRSKPSKKTNVENDTDATKTKKRISFNKLMYTCNVCDENFPLPRELRQHFRQHHLKLFLSSNKEVLSNSLQIDLSDNKKDLLPHKCDTCLQNFETFEFLTQHQLQHPRNSEPSVHTCQKCNKTFNDSNSLKRHELLHIMEKPYKCSKCNMSFTRADVLQVHDRNEHTNEDDVSKLKLGKQTGKKRKSKSQRTIIHCEFCDKTFVRQDQLQLHSRVHTGERPFPCKLCGKAFSDPRGLAYHEVTHSNIRPYCCTVCGMTFRRLHHLNDHEMNHREHVERPFECGSCDKSFKHKKHLNKHLLTHTSLKEHRCDICSKEFARKDNLQQHIKKVHEKGLTTSAEIPTTIIIPTTTVAAQGIQMEPEHQNDIVYIDLRQTER